MHSPCGANTIMKRVKTLRCHISLSAAFAYCCYYEGVYKCKSKGGEAETSEHETIIFGTFSKRSSLLHSLADGLRAAP